MTSDWHQEIASLSGAQEALDGERLREARLELEERRKSALALTEVTRRVLNGGLDAAGKRLVGDRSEDDAGLHFRLRWNVSFVPREVRITLHKNAGLVSWQYLYGGVVLGGRSMVDARAIDEETVKHLVRGLFDQGVWEQVVTYVRLSNGVEVEIPEAATWEENSADVMFFDLTGQAVRLFPKEVVETQGRRLKRNSSQDFEVPLEVFSPWGRKKGPGLLGVAAVVAGAVVVGTLAAGASIAADAAHDTLWGYTSDDHKQEEIIRRANR